VQSGTSCDGVSSQRYRGCAVRFVCRSASCVSAVAPVCCRLQIQGVYCKAHIQASPINPRPTDTARARTPQAPAAPRGVGGGGRVARSPRGFPGPPFAHKLSCRSHATPKETASRQIFLHFPEVTAARLCAPRTVRSCRHFRGIAVLSRFWPEER